MGNPNQRKNAKNSKPPRAVDLFNALQKKHMETQKAEAAVDVTKISDHPSIQVIKVDDKTTLTLDLEFATEAGAQPVDMTTLNETLPKYIHHITNISIRIHEPPSTRTVSVYRKRVDHMKNLLVNLNKFWLTDVFILVVVDSENFQQLKLAAAFHGFHYRNWKLGYEYNGEITKITGDSEIGRRLRGVYKAEFLPLMDSQDDARMVGLCGRLE